MKSVKRYILIVAISVAAAVSLSSCWHQDYYFMSDDEWSHQERVDDKFILNGEFDLDDMDR